MRQSADFHVLEDFLTRGFPCAGEFSLRGTGAPSQGLPQPVYPFSGEEVKFDSTEVLASDSLPTSPTWPFRAKREQRNTFYGRLPETRGPNLVLTVLHVP